MEDAEDDIAVIGIGCNFPGGEGLENFWRVLLEGKNCAVDIPTERFDTTFWYDADDSKPGKTQTNKAALIQGFNEFDHKFFGITEAEAEFMDPQQKLLLQCTYRALEDAGIAMESISGSRTGVYIGLMNRDYEILRSNSPATITHYNGTGTAMSVAANRISFTFNLTGPSFAIDSACSSSLVALHVACQAIKQGDCEMALCGGVSCIIEPRVFVALSKAKMISPEGTSKPFSSRADGYGRGEGCGVVLLKPLKNAIKDCNKIWGIISKTAVNQDGHSVTPITKPSVTQQQELLQRVYSESDIANVQYIEAHGTGTPVGDQTEAASISNVIAKAKPPGSETLWIGSVKGNIGHTESAAGVAGIIKVGIATLLKQWGVKPDAVLGHSVEDLSHLSSEKMLDCLVTCCDLFRQIVLALNESKRSCTVRVITYRSAETIVDHVSPGFVLSGMMRACAAEMAGLSFQLIDLASVTGEDIQTLVRVMNTCKKQEVMISKGQASTTRIARTPLGDATLCQIAAAAKIIIPEAVCYSTKRLQFLKETPCVSYFILAWEILQRMLSKVVDAISKIKQRFSSCSIKGVFHSAAVLHDALIKNLDESLFRKVLQPKRLQENNPTALPSTVTICSAGERFAGPLRLPQSHSIDSIRQLKSHNFCATSSSLPAAEQLAGAQSL
ncbi:hypothetical protein FQN60_013539 [Etheostoma spectabile]|uniref:Ketosynthase family 3 (KS3) domain-containing protein n=1 Tax=Etheostoma spectabile TaxID=54343 RepID=A0A5J5CKD7_9PERO|nr:hypothetical protein FQN60_013539 [Etheostoma spectabile]